MFNSWTTIFMILNLDLTALPCIVEQACTGAIIMVLRCVHCALYTVYTVHCTGAIIMGQLRWIGGTTDMAEMQGPKEIKCFPLFAF